MGKKKKGNDGECRLKEGKGWEGRVLEGAIAYLAAVGNVVAMCVWVRVGLV